MNYLLTGSRDSLPFHELFSDYLGDKYILLLGKVILQRVAINGDYFYGLCCCENKKKLEYFVKTFCNDVQYVECVSPRPFSLGNVFLSEGASKLFGDNQMSALSFVVNHASCQWGAIPSDEAVLNNVATVSGGLIKSQYRYQECDIFIVTESDRTYTTLLLSSEYQG